MSSTLPKKSVCYLLISNAVGYIWCTGTHRGVKIVIIPLLIVVLEQKKDLGFSNFLVEWSQ